LQVLDEGERQHRPIIKVPHDSGNIGPSEPGHRSEPSLASYELQLPVSYLTHNDRL
jgi:hypothetical protein